MQHKESTPRAPKRRPLLYAEWLEHFTSWKASGQTQQAYCLSNNLSLVAFIKQYSRKKKTEKITPQSTGNFLPVQLIDTPVSQPIELIFRSGMVMKIPSSVPFDSVLKSLKSYL